MQKRSPPLLLYLEGEEFTVSAVDFETFAIVPRRINDEHLSIQMQRSESGTVYGSYNLHSTFLDIFSSGGR